MVGGEIEHRRGDHPDIDHAATGRADALDQRIAQRRARQSAVPANRDLAHRQRTRLRAQRSADRARRFHGQRTVDDAPHVIRLEDRRIDGSCHVRCRTRVRTRFAAPLSGMDKIQSNKAPVQCRAES